MAAAIPGHFFLFFFIRQYFASIAARILSNLIIHENIPVVTLPRTHMYVYTQHLDFKF